MSRGNYASKWSSEDCAEIKRLLMEGLSCSQIGARFGVSRNAIIGINHRRGLFMHKPSAPKASPKSVRAVKIAAPKRIKSKIARQPAIPLAPGVPRPGWYKPLPDDGIGPRSATLINMAHDGCRWVVVQGEAGHGDESLMCGAKAQRYPYCEKHRARAFN